MDASDPAGSSSPLAIALAKLNSRVQTLLDKSSPLIGPRWAALILVLVIYTLRVWLLRGFYIVSYGLGIFNLNLLLGFLTPQFDVDSEGPMLPTKGQEEFKPFVRRLPEFKFWCASNASACAGATLLDPSTLTNVMHPMYHPLGPWQSCMQSWDS